jgi:hypothetical protein
MPVEALPERGAASPIHALESLLDGLSLPPLPIHPRAWIWQPAMLLAPPPIA